MKYLSGFIVMVVLLMVVSSCKKDSTRPVSDPVLGSWELRSQSGMFLTNYPAGNGRTISFTGNTYQKRNNGQITEQGNFLIFADATASAETCLTLPAGSYQNRIFLSGDSTGRKLFLQIDSDTLNIIGGCFALDGGTLSKYIKQ